MLNQNWLTKGIIMLVEKMVSECDVTHKKFDPPVKGAACVIQGSTGRWCETLHIGPDELAHNENDVISREEAIKQATEIGGNIEF